MSHLKAVFRDVMRKLHKSTYCFSGTRMKKKQQHFTRINSEHENDLIEGEIEQCNYEHNDSNGV